jgi:hypothetical protein
LEKKWKIKIFILTLLFFSFTCFKKKKIEPKSETLSTRSDIKAIRSRRFQNVLRKRLKVINKLGNDLIFLLFLSYIMFGLLQYININYIHISFLIKFVTIVIIIIQIIIVMFALLTLIIIFIYAYDMNIRFINIELKKK